jgi:N-acetylmuramic acid 6-phosphate etherase
MLNSDLRATEQSGELHDLENRSSAEILKAINEADKTVAWAVEKELPQIERLTQKVISVLEAGGRIFYVGAGTSGRLGVVDASELPPTYGVAQGTVIGLIAGGDQAIRKAVEFAEDKTDGAIGQLDEMGLNKKDMVIGIAASGTTPYVVGALQHCQKIGVPTGCIVCNRNSPVAAASDFPIEVVTGPEVVAGSTRMKAGTAQKMVLNLISTTSMIKTGHVVGNKMVDMQLTNQKLVERGVRMILESKQIDENNAKELLLQLGSVRKVLQYLSEQGV